jgi:hypothetical protein
MSDLYNQLLKEVGYAKTSVSPQNLLHTVHGKISMARQLEAITVEEYLDLEHKCVCEGINNPEYFDR